MTIACDARDSWTHATTTRNDTVMVGGLSTSDFSGEVSEDKDLDGGIAETTYWDEMTGVPVDETSVERHPKTNCNITTNVTRTRQFHWMNGHQRQDKHPIAGHAANRDLQGRRQLLVLGAKRGHVHADAVSEVFDLPTHT